MTRARTPSSLPLPPDRIFGATLASLALAALLVACGGGSSGGGASDTVGGADVTLPPDAGTPPVDAGAPKDAGTPEAGGDAAAQAVAIVFPIEQPVRVPVEMTRKIPLLVVDPAPVDGAHLSLALEPVEGDGDATLEATSVFTGASGSAEVMFRANEVAPATYDLVARLVGGAEEARLRIEVTPPATGTLRVELEYGGTQPLTEIRVGVVPDDEFSCAEWYAPSPPASGETRVTSLGTPVEFTLPAEERYTLWVTARARDATGAPRLAAAGCLDGSYVRSNTVDTVFVTIYDIVLNTAGLYDMIAVFDFTDALPDNEIGRIVDLVVTLFSDPGEFVVDLVDTVVDVYLGQAVGQVVGWALDAFRDEIEDAVNDWLAANAPDWFDPAMTIGQDLTQVVSRLELLADLRISKIEGDWYIQGDEEWIGLALYWRVDCPPEGDPAYDPACGRIVLSLADLQDTQFPLDLVQGVWRGTVTGVDVLTINPHPVELNYGRVILYVLNELLLPALSDGEYHSLLDAALGLVDCPSIAEDVSGDFLDVLGIDQDDIEAYCETAIASLVLPLESALYDLGADSRIRLQGSARLVDDDEDLTVDRIVDGAWDGRIEWDPGAGWGEGAFTGTWEATRK